MVENITPKELSAINLLQAEVQAFLLFRNDIEARVRKSCVQRNQPYNGLRSWPEVLRNWRDKKRKALIMFAKDHGLCRKHIKAAVIALESMENT